MNDIEQFLRDNKPQTPSEDNFIIEMNARLEAAESVRRVVAEQRRRNRSKLLAALVAGIALGCLFTAIVLLRPVSATAFNTEFMVRLSLFLHSWARYIIMLLIAVGAITLGLVFAVPRRR